MTEASSSRHEGAALLHPLTLALLALWISNDHVGKAVFSNWLTGKLSDVAGLAVAPLLIVSAVELSRGMSSIRARRTVAASSIAAVGAAMIAIKLFEPCAWAYRVGLGAGQWPLHAVAALAAAEPLPSLHTVRLTMDATDLMTLPSLWIAWWIVERTHGRETVGGDQNAASSTTSPVTPT